MFPKILKDFGREEFLESGQSGNTLPLFGANLLGALVGHATTTPQWFVAFPPPGVAIALR